MPDENQQPDSTETPKQPEAPKQPGTPKVEVKMGDAKGLFTQEQVNSMLADQKRQLQSRFADYEDVKAKAGKYDADLTAAHKERFDTLRRAISAETGVPANLLTGSNEDELKASADQANNWRKQAAESGSLHPGGGFFSGASPTDGSSADPKERAAAALRGLRNLN